MLRICSGREGKMQKSVRYQGSDGQKILCHPEPSKYHAILCMTSIWIYGNRQVCFMFLSNHSKPNIHFEVICHLIIKGHRIIIFLQSIHQIETAKGNWIMKNINSYNWKGSTHHSPPFLPSHTDNVNRKVPNSIKIEWLFENLPQKYQLEICRHINAQTRLWGASQKLSCGTTEILFLSGPHPKSFLGLTSWSFLQLYILVIEQYPQRKYNTKWAIQEQGNRRSPKWPLEIGAAQNQWVVNNGKWNS